MRQYLIVIIGLLLSACQNAVENPFCGNTTMAHSDNGTKLNAQLLVSGDSMPHVNDIIVVGDLLFADMDDKDARIRIFSTQGKELGKYGKTGRAENEYTGGMSFVRQSDTNKLYIKDVNKGCISIIDTDSLLMSDQKISPKVIRTFPRVLNAFISNDSDLIYEHEVQGSYALASRGINGEADNWDETLYTSTDDAFSNYHSYMAFSDKNHKVASAMRFRNQINFFDTNNKDRKSVIVDWRDNEEADRHQYYCSVTANDNNIYALFMNQNAEESYKIAKPMEVHVFDWDGNFKNKYVVDEYIVRVAADKQGNLYGRDLESNIYKYSVQ